MGASTRFLTGLATAMALCGGCAVVDSATRARKRRLARHGVEPHVITPGADTIKYWKGGDEDGETILFLHGFGGNALYQWYPQLYAFSDHYRVLAPDLLWFGESSSTEEDFSTQHQARAIRALLRHEEVEQFHLVGLSYGGMVTHELIGQSPGSVDKVVLVASPARAFMAGDKKPILHELGVATVEDLLLPRSATDLRRLMQLAYYDPPWVPNFVARQVVDEFYGDRRDQHVAMLTSVEANTQTHRDQFEVPHNETLIVWGEADRVFPESAAWRLRGELGNQARLCVFDRAAHAPHLERVNEVNHLINDFLGNRRIKCVGREQQLPDGVLP